MPEKREEHRLTCTACGMSHVVVLNATDERPTHRCSSGKVAAFDKVGRVKDEVLTDADRAKARARWEALGPDAPEKPTAEYNPIQRSYRKRPSPGGYSKPTVVI